MSRRGNCWDNAPQESFFGHMKDHIKNKLASCTNFNDVLAVVDDYMDYYNNRRYQWHLAKLSPNEYYHFVTTGEYPLDIPNKPESPVITKSPSQLGNKFHKRIPPTGAGTQSRDSTLGARARAALDEVTRLILS